MNKEEIYQYLTDKNIPYEKTEHKAVYNMEELGGGGASVSGVGCEEPVCPG